MAVFISHRSTDDALAKRIHDYLRAAGLNCYLDDVDHSLLYATDITTAIISRLCACSHLLAVVSDTTSGSWWVPFEIGVGTVQETRIATYRAAYITLPDYLKKWPILSSTTDLQAYARYCDRDAKILLEKGLTTAAASASVQTASQFHRELKRALGQP